MRFLELQAEAESPVIGKQGCPQEREDNSMDVFSCLEIVLIG